MVYKKTRPQEFQSKQWCDRDNISDSYYGWIDEIWELDYFALRIPIFKCTWIDNRKGRVRKDKDGFIIVDHNRLGYQHDPFILAKQVRI
jgi:hypothetical protein